jgi:ATP-dependent Clp protease ATP-binding subunit ClpB
MTSNLGSHIISERSENLKAENREKVFEQTKAEVMELLRKTIRPEFLNRIDELIMFRPLTAEEISGVVRLMLNNLVQVLKKNDITLTYTDNAVQLIAVMGFDPQYGARPVKRVIQREVMNALSKKILSGEVSKEANITLDSENNRLEFRN